MINRLSEEQGRVLVETARKTIMKELHLPVVPEEEGADKLNPPDPALQEKLGVFVTLHYEGQLRGCIGSLVGRKPIIEGVRENAINAAFNDFRFRQVTPRELAKIDIEVSVLSEPKPLSYKGVDDLVARLRPGVDGVIIRKGGMSATFLPQVWDQLPDVAAFLSHLCQKAGLPAEEWRRGELEVSIYQVQCFSELELQSDRA